MTYQTDEELDEMARDLCHTGELSMPYRCEISDAITTLRTQLAEVSHMLALSKLTTEAVLARAERAEAALAAQIETDAGIARHRHAVSEDAFQKGLGAENRHCALEAIHIADKIADQPHDRTALDRMLAEAREKALREAIIEGMRIAIFTPIEQVPAAIDDAILALIEAPDGSR